VFVALLDLLDCLEELPKGESVIWREKLQVGCAEEGQEGGDAGGWQGQAVGEGGTEELLADGREGKQGAQVGGGWGEERWKGGGGQ
jgi:hypothetical protein